MELYLDKRAVKQIRISAADAIEEGDAETLVDDIIEAFPEEQLELLEQILGGTDFVEILDEILADWSGDDVDELFELLETQLSDHGVDLKYQTTNDDDFDEEEEEEEDEDFDDFDDYDEPGFEDEL